MSQGIKDRKGSAWPIRSGRYDSDLLRWIIGTEFADLFVIVVNLSKGVVVNYMVTVSLVTMAVSGLVIIKVWKS